MQKEWTEIELSPGQAKMLDRQWTESAQNILAIERQISRAKGQEDCCGTKTYLSIGPGGERLMSMCLTDKSGTPNLRQLAVFRWFKPK